MTRSAQGAAPPAGSPETQPTYEPEVTAAERIARILTLVRRARPHILPMIAIAVIGCAISLWLGMRIKRQYQSECTIELRSMLKPGGDPDNNVQKRNAKLKDMLYERARLEGAIRKFNLYPEVVESRGILDATEAMSPHVGLRARESGRYVISFDATESESHEARALVRDVAQYLAESVVDDYVGGNMRELKKDAAFFAKEVASANEKIDEAVKQVTTFLSKHPEFATEGSAMGISPGLAPKVPGKVASNSASVAAKQTDPILAALWRERARLEADLKTGETPPPVAPPAPNLSKEAAANELESAKKRYAEAQAELLAKSGKLTPEHPDMKTAQNAVTQAAQQLAAARAAYAAFDTPAVADAGPAPPSEQQQKLAAVIAQIEKREKALKDVASAKPTGPAPAASSAAPVGDPHVALETEWQRVLRMLGEAKSRHDDLKKRFETAELSLKAAEAAAAEAASVIEPAYRPTHPMPSKRAVTAMMGGIASIFLALLYGLARVTLDERMYDAGDVEALGLVPVLGTVPEIESKQEPLPPMPQPTPAPATRSLARLGNNEHALSLKGSSPEDDALFEGWPVRAVRLNAVPNSAPVLAVLLDEPKAIAALRVIRHRLEIAQTKGMRVIAVTSAREGEGKSTVAAQLAVVLAESQRARVVLVEGNLVRPSLARILGFEVPEGAGLSAQILHALRGGNDPWQLVALGPSIHVLAESSKEEGFPRVLHSAHFQQMIAVLAEIYDFVIVDGPAVLGSGDANAVEMAVDGLVMVARSGESKRGELRKAQRQVGAQNAIGAVLAAIPAEREASGTHL